MRGDPVGVADGARHVKRAAVGIDHRRRDDAQRVAPVAAGDARLRRWRAEVHGPDRGARASVDRVDVVAARDHDEARRPPRPVLDVEGRAEDGARVRTVEARIERHPRGGGLRQRWLAEVRVAARVVVALEHRARGDADGADAAGSRRRACAASPCRSRLRRRFRVVAPAPAVPVVAPAPALPVSPRCPRSRSSVPCRRRPASRRRPTRTAPAATSTAASCSSHRRRLFFAATSIFAATIFGNLIKLVAHAVFASHALACARGSRDCADSGLSARIRHDRHGHRRGGGSPTTGDGGEMPCAPPADPSQPAAALADTGCMDDDRCHAFRVRRVGLRGQQPAVVRSGGQGRVPSCCRPAARFGC